MDAKLNVLYVDDEPINLQLFEINFSKKYDVYTAISGFNGLKVLENQPEIEVVISDMKMPEMNGIEFITNAKERFPDKRFYILTGYEITPEINAALENGLILKYFQKPFNPKDIDSIIENQMI